MPAVIIAIKSLNQRVTAWLYRKWLAMSPAMRRVTIGVFIVILAYALAQLCELLPEELIKPCHAADKLIRSLGLPFLGL